MARREAPDVLISVDMLPLSTLVSGLSSPAPAKNVDGHTHLGSACDCHARARVGMVATMRDGDGRRIGVEPSMREVPAGPRTTWRSPVARTAR